MTPANSRPAPSVSRTTSPGRSVRFDVGAGRERRRRKALNEFGTPRAKGFARRNFEPGVRSLGETEQAVFERLCDLGTADGERGRLCTERVDNVPLLAVYGHGDTIMKRDVRTAPDRGANGSIDHGREF